ncbi:hypothetical protein AGLY_017348 [Aphis glycines]|uniref:Uncharacterized protein n=1 Tax=Aphis glycines TaxID=307491 RepID=A0A6G0SWC2_APHGL|nr:hypothetical protein AGLY_017348 [Aphis glycines]
MKTVGKCSLLTNSSIKDIRFAVENHPQKSYLNIDLVEFRFYVRFAVFGAFFLFISIIMKTVEKCSLLTVISIKDIRFAVENHPQKSYLNIDLVEFRFYVRFAVFGAFFFVYLNYYENCWEMFPFNESYLNIDLVEFRFYHQDIRFARSKITPKFVIGAFFRLVMLYKGNKKKIFRKNYK